jgi:hypothetical protein
MSFAWMMQLAHAFLEPSQRTKHHVSALVETHEQEHKESRDERQRDADGGQMRMATSPLQPCTAWCGSHQ